MIVLDNIKIMIEDKLNNQFDPLFNENEISSLKIKYEESIINVYEEAKGKHVIYYCLNS